VHELLFKAVHYESLRKELEALRGGQATRRASAGVARTSVGQPAVPAPATTRAEAIRRAAAKYRAAGGQLSADEERAYLASVERSTVGF
jgi:hypothetical protein